MKLELRDDMRSLEKKMDDMFREMWSGRASSLWPTSFGRIRRTFSPSSDVFRRDDDLVARIELPGIDPDKDLSVEISDGELVVKGSRHESDEVKQDDYYRKEVWQGSYERHLPLPQGTTDDDVTAEYDKGILEVTIKGAGKTIEEPQEPEAKSIPVKTKA